MGVDGLLGLFSQFHNIVFICKLFFSGDVLLLNGYGGMIE
jgi:hypothetical protein